MHVKLLEYLVNIVSCQATSYLIIGVIIAINSVYSTYIILFLYFVNGFFFARIVIISNVYLSTYFESEIGTATGFVAALQNLMMACAPFLGAVILVKEGPAMVYFSASVIGLSAITLLKLLLARRGNTAFQT